MAGTYTFDFSKQPGRSRTRFYAPDPETAFVSVITPYYNAGKYFEQTFNSVMNQTFPWFEWIIVNDGSPNQEDVEILHRLAAQDARIKVVTQENGGLSCARNTGIVNASTDLIVPLDADDVLAPTYLECLYWGMKCNPEAAWCYTSTYGFHDQEYVWKYPFDAEKLKTYNFLNYTAMIRKKDIEDIGGYKVEKWSYYEDWRFWLEMLAQSKKPVHIDSCLFWYRRLASGMLSTINKDPERVEFCNRIIETAAAQADGTVKPIEYPLRGTRKPYHYPVFEKFDRKAYPEHNQKNVLWLTAWMQMGGADKFNLDAIAGLNEYGVRNHVITTQVSENEWRQKFEEYIDEIFALPEFLDPTHYLEFVSYYIQSREIDVLILTNSYDGYYMIPWLRKHFPNLVIVDYVHMEEWYWKNGGYARAAANINGITEKTFVCNSLTREVMIDHFGRDPETVECLYIGVDHEYFAQENEETGYLHKLLDLPQERPIVLFPCRINPRKRPFLMLEIAKRVKKNMPEAAFVVVGTGEQYEELLGEIKEQQLEDTVYCIGATDQMRACYRDSAVTLICSLKEGLALTAYESLAMQTPVVSSDVGGQRDLIDHTVGALLPLYQSEELELDIREFRDEEIEQYVNALLEILQNPELGQKLGKNGRQRIEGGFTLKQMTRNLYDYLCLACSESAMRTRRNYVSEILKEVPGLSDDYMSVYLLTEAKAAECDHVYKLEQEWEGFFHDLKKVYTKLLQDYEEQRTNGQAVWEAKCLLDSENARLTEELNKQYEDAKAVWEAKCLISAENAKLTEELNKQYEEAKNVWESRCYFEERYQETQACLEQTIDYKIRKIIRKIIRCLCKS